MIAKVVLDEMARTNESVRKRIFDYSARIVALAEAYRILGKQFSFGSDGQLDARVNSILVELSDAVLTDAVYAAKKGLDGTEEEDDEIIVWARNRADAQNTIDKYSSHLKYILEGWLAIAFANKISSGQLMTMVMSYMENPYITPLWKKAFGEGLSYAAQIIREGGYHWGKGTPISPVKGMSIVEATIINSAYQKGCVEGFARKGAIGYRVVRGSNYPCEICDEATLQIYPLTEVVLPLHPNCVCYAVPVFADEIKPE